MARPTKTPPDALRRALDQIRDTDSGAHLRAALAVLLPAEAGLTIEETARVLGRNRTWVSRARNRFISGEGGFYGPEARGGRRQELLSQERELQLVKQAVVQSGESGEHVRHHLRELLADMDLYPAESTLTGILARAAAKLMPGGETWELDHWSGLLSRIVKLEQQLESIRPRRN